jgi:hypothetical protein
MNNKLKKNGFSLTEVLLAVGTLAIGMLFIAGTFLAGVYFTTVSTERTIAAIAADEAFAKIKIYGVNLNLPLWQTPDPTIYCVDFNNVSSTRVNPSEFAYPSTNTVTGKQYYWSALCRQVAPDVNLVQVTVFVCRKAGSGTKYRNPADPFNLNASLFYPVPVKVGVLVVLGIGNEKKLKINEAGKEIFVNDGYTIVDDQTGQIYRVLKRYAEQPDTIELDRPWLGGPTGSVWVVPPAAGGGRYPCIAVYQKVIKF